MAEEILKAEYNFTRLELYSITRTMCASAKEDIADFHDFSERYDEAYIEEIEDAVDAAEALPDEDERTSNHETLKVELSDLNKICLDNSNKLERYIEKAFAKNLRKIKNDEAGRQKYAKAANKNWEFTVALNKDMNDFVDNAEYQAKLEADNNMPHAFVAKVGTDKINFHKKYESFKTARQTSDETQAKLTADNNVKAKLSELAGDGQVVYANNEGKRNRYIIDRVKDLVSPPGSASLLVEVQNHLFQPVTSVVVTIQATGKAAITVPVTIEIDGSRSVANFPSLDVARYDWGVYEAEGEKKLLVSGKKDVDKGRNARLKVVLPE